MNKVYELFIEVWRKLTQNCHLDQLLDKDETRFRSPVEVSPRDG